jgi:hypothetical protein
MTRGWTTGAALVALLGGAGVAAADPVERPIAATVTRMVEASADRGEAWMVGPGGEAPGAAARQQMARSLVAPNRSRGNRVGRAIAGAAVGAVGGAFAGGYLGAAIDGDCGGCDDPGFKGFLIGFPVGGVVGGVLGGLYLFR